MDNFNTEGPLIATVDGNNSVDVVCRFIAVGEVIEEVVGAEDPQSLTIQTKLAEIVLEDDQFVEGVKGKCQIWGNTIKITVMICVFYALFIPTWFIFVDYLV